jgi:ribosomal RNA-processing protein 8
MKNEEIRKYYEEFIKEYEKYFKNNEEIWYETLVTVKKYIDNNKQKPSTINKNVDIKKLGKWLSYQQTNYKKQQHNMKQEKIREQWTNFIIEYQEYFPNNSAIKSDKPIKKSTTISAKENSETKIKSNKALKLSEYQELTKKMSIQKSENTKQMFIEKPDLWHKYHDSRDFSFKGYDKQDEIPINRIINYINKKSNKKLKILDLGCGRNLIKDYFKDNNKLTIIGYDYVSHNGSIECDISNLPDKSESIDICIFSQSLMGSNWKDYIREAVRVLRYNGEMIISESIERFDIIKKYIEELKLHIKYCDYKENKRWFFLHIINDNNEDDFYNDI